MTQPPAFTPDEGVGRLAASGDRATDAPHEAPAGLRPDGSVSTGAGVDYRSACFETARAVMAALPVDDRAKIECYANSEFWAGWNAAIRHAERIARGRYRCWQESTLGSSQPEDDVSACDDIARAISFEVHRLPPVSRPLTASGMSAGTAETPQEAQVRRTASPVAEGETPKTSRNQHHD